MSSFTDFDEFLKSQDSSKKKAEEETLEKIKKSRIQIDPFVSDIFSLFKDYYDTIILPRRSFHMIFKKKENLQKTEYKDKPYFLYRINLVPVEILPLSFDPSSHPGRDHLSWKHITEHDWHFDVSMQFTLALYASDEPLALMPEITIHTWGNIDQEKSNALIPGGMSISYLTAWHLPYTRIELRGQEDEVKKNFTETLMVITPRILSHLEEVWKIKK